MAQLYLGTGEKTAYWSEYQARTIKKSLKMLLTENVDWHDTPVAPVFLPSPEACSDVSSPIRTPEKVSEECWCRHN
jgi:hypothetical protein